MTDNINHPSHYTSGQAECPGCEAPIECIDIVKHLGFLEGNIMKYIWRHKIKNGIEDLKKARWYLNQLIAEYGGENLNDKH